MTLSQRQSEAYRWLAQHAGAEKMREMARTTTDEAPWELLNEEHLTYWQLEMVADARPYVWLGNLLLVRIQARFDVIRRSGFGLTESVRNTKRVKNVLTEIEEGVCLTGHNATWRIRLSRIYRDERERTEFTLGDLSEEQHERYAVHLRVIDQLAEPLLSAAPRTSTTT